MSRKVLLLAPHPFYVERGTPMAELALLQSLTREGYTVDVLAYPEGEDPGLPRARILRVPRIPGIGRVGPGLSWKKVVYDLLFVVELVRCLRRGGYDVVHAVEESAFMVWSMGRVRRVPFVWDMDSSLPDELVAALPVLRPLEGLFRSLEARVLRDASGVLTMCPSLAERARSAGAREPVAVAEDATLLDDRPGGLPTPPDLPESPTGRVIMYVGNLAPYQGVDLLVEAFARLCAERDDVELVVVGGGGEALEQLQERVASRGIGARVRLLGSRPPDMLGNYLGAADVLVSPRLRGQNTPMKLYSYLDSGRPVVATRIPAHTQVVDSNTAVLVEPHPRALCEGLSGLLDEPGRGQELARRARELVRRHYTPEARRRKILSFYAQLERRLGLDGA